MLFKKIFLFVKWMAEQVKQIVKVIYKRVQGNRKKPPANTEESDCFNTIVGRRSVISSATRQKIVYKTDKNILYIVLPL